MPTIKAQVASLLAIPADRAEQLIVAAETLYIGKMKERFSSLRINDRLKRTNPFLLRIRGLSTVREWAAMQVQTALFASEEEAVGHLLEAIAKICHPNAADPKLPDDFDYEVVNGGEVVGYQVKMSWDCMPMSSRKNLSNTIRQVRAAYERQGKNFTGVFASCYGRAKTSKQPGQEYVSLASREFWTRVGNGNANYDAQVGNVCALLCSEFRKEIQQKLVPDLVNKLAAEAEQSIGDGSGNLDYQKLFRRINP